MAPRNAVKDTSTKCNKEGGDPFLALLSYRATPIDHHLKSPTELLTNRKFKTLLPMSNRVSLTAYGTFVHAASVLWSPLQPESRPDPQTTPHRLASTNT